MNGRDIDNIIRRAAGYTSDPPTQRVEPHPTDDVKLRAAALADVPAEHAHRLEGDTPAALLEDAQRFAAETGIRVPRTDFDSGVREPAIGRDNQNMDDALRGERDARRERSDQYADGYRRMRERD